MNPLFLVLKLVLLTIDFLLTIVTFGWVKAVVKLITPQPLRSVPVGDDASHRVHPDVKKNGKFTTAMFDGFETLYDYSINSFKKFADRKAMGTREYLGQHSEKVKKFGGIKWRTYEEVEDASMKFGAALRSHGLVPAADKATLDKINTPCSLAIFENTSAEWMISALGAFSQSVIVTTIYATLGIDAVVDSINDVNISAILCNKANVKILVEKSKKMKTLKTIIYTSDMVAPDANIEIPAAPKGVKIISFEDFVASGDTTAFTPEPPKKDTCAVIMFTSGSTGKPKGVVLTHEHVCAAMSAINSILFEGKLDVYLGYLPLAHILEMTAEFSMLAGGNTICYADPKTLTTTGAYPIGALEQFSPTVMAGVPKIWDVIKKGIQAKVALSSPVAQFLVKTAFEARTFALNHGYDTPLFKALVFKKFSKVVGGELRLALSGGGPLNSDVQVFVRTCFGCPLFQGYGLTETCAGLTIQDPNDLRQAIAGMPIPSCEVKLSSTPDVCDKAGQAYLSTDTTDVNGNKIFGRGEVLAKGFNISLGYYDMPEKTKEVFHDDGFFETGDIGQFMEDGSLRIVDRKKNLVKLKGGEYIAMEQMEMTYGNCAFVDAVAGGICCYGDGDMDRPVALMQLNEVVTMKWAKENGIAGDFNTVKDSKELMAAVLDEMKKEHKKGGLAGNEKLVAIAFLTEPWTPENGCLTAANKLQRRQVVVTFEKEFEETRAKGIF
uniref:AMP-dependent synthetase/ligase domain-containing protein n=1 Tax=Asterionellopsis glacialis TaxID=33640 RepID=A0A7S0KY27_9STRA|mmetsp:Transcript_1801/g.2602  ORF Transcript_1801/g.2602 Transcript_1801/m.2602 type:complete len:721 (+) Transcript_1801:93-2255(+)